MRELFAINLASIAAGIAAGLVVFFAFWIAASITRVVVRRLMGGRKIDAYVVESVARVAYVSVLAFGLVTALGTAGLNIAALVAGLGLTGFALGFALKDIVSNILSGFLLLIYKPFRRGDHIAVSGFEGIVVNMDFRYTTLETPEKRILVPNSNLFTNTISVRQKQGG